MNKNIKQLGILFLGLCLLWAAPVEALLHTGGDGDGYDAAQGATEDVANISSAADQTFTVGDAATAISAITVTQEVGLVGGGINTTDDIRITIPAGLSMVWDTGDTTATIGGAASGKVSGTVMYEDAGKTLVVDVTTNFADDDVITISDLAFTSFTSAGLTAQDNLDLEIDNAGTIEAVDSSSITIFDESIHGGGSGDGYDAGDYGGSNIYTWTGTSDAAAWTDQGNWDIGDGSAGNDGVPDDASDKVVINSTAHSIVTGGAVTIGELALSGSFSGTVTSNGIFIIDDSGVWDGDLTVGAGTFDANDQTFTVDGDTILSGGVLQTGTGAVTFGNVAADTVTMSGGTLDIESDATDTDISITASTWTNSGGTIQFLGSSSTTVFSALSTYYHLTINASGNTFTSNTPLDIDGNLTIMAGSLDLDTNSNDITLAGSLANSGTFTSGNTTITFDGTTSVTVDTGGTGAGQDFNNVVINKTSVTDANDNVTFQTSAALINGTLTVTDGELIQSDANLTSGAVTVAAAAKWTNNSDGNVTLSGDVANAGTISFDATTASPDGIQLRSSVSGSRRNWQGAGTFSMTDVDVKDMSAAGGTPASIAVTSGTNTGNNVNWFFGGSVTLGGAVYTDKTEVTALASMPLTLVHYNGSVQTIYTTTADGSGNFSVAMTTVNDGDPVVIYINDAGGGQEGVLVYKSDADGAANLSVYKDAVVLRGDAGWGITNADLNNIDDADDDIKYAISGGNVTFEDNFEVVILTGSSYIPGGTVTWQHVDLNGTFNAAGNAVTVGGNWDATGGTFTSGSNVVTFDGTTTLTAGSSNAFNHLTITGTVTPSTHDLDIDGNLTLSGVATLSNDNNVNIAVAGNWANSGTFSAGTGTVTFDGAGTTVVSGNNTFNHFNVTMAGKAITLTAGSTQTVTGSLTLTGASGNLITLRSSVDGSKWDLTFPNGAQNATFVDVKDSDANTNTVTCLDCTDTGNNNANWVFTSSSAISAPTGGSTVDTTPTVVGTGTAGDTIQIKDKDNNVVGTTTVDSNGNFEVEVTTALAVGSNSLRSFAGAASGTVVNITVAATPTPTQQPQMTSHTSGERVHGSQPTISGQGKAGETIIIQAKDDAGNLLLQTVGSGTVDGSGNYAVTLTTALAAGTNTLVVLVDGVASNEVSLELTDPFGVVFDAVTNLPIEGATVRLFRAVDDALAVPGVDIAATDSNPQVTGTDGFYSFLTANADYYFTISALGYDYPSTASSFPAGRVIVTGSKAETFTVAGVIIEMDHPMDGNGAQLIVTKEANKSEARVGSVVTYTVTIENPSSGDVPGVYLEDKIPSGFKYMPGRALLEGAVLTDPTGQRPLVFSIGTVSANTTMTLKYQLVVGSGVEPGGYDNVAFARYSGGTVISNQSRATVEITPDALFDRGTVVGKVMMLDVRCSPDLSAGLTLDAKNQMEAEDGIHSISLSGTRLSVRGDNDIKDSEEIKLFDGRERKSNTSTCQRNFSENQQFDQGPELMPSSNECFSSNIQRLTSNIKIIMEDGTKIMTDADGKFHIVGLSPGRHLFRLDERSLPTGIDVVGNKAVVIDVRPGMIQKVNFQVKGSVQTNAPNKTCRDGACPVLLELSQNGDNVVDVNNVNNTCSDRACPVPTGKSNLFFVALGDTKMGYTRTTGNIEAVQSQDQFNQGFWSEGKLAFYLEGKILGKYLITASLDTERERQELFRNVDPDQYYPVYGDQSQVDYASANTQGMLYVKLDWDQSSVLWGNYQTDFTDTEFAQFQRGLYGAKLDYKGNFLNRWTLDVGRVSGRSIAQRLNDGESASPSPATPSNTQHLTSNIIAFHAQAQQQSAHNEFMGTGGSLFYLKHTDVVEGSAVVVIEVRDKVTGLVLETQSLVEGGDYELDAAQGRLQLRQPASFFVDAGSIIDSGLLDGNPLVVLVDYSYIPKDKLNQSTYGARLKQSLGDHVKVGGTYVREGQAQENYELEGVDVAIDGGFGLKDQRQVENKTCRDGACPVLIPSSLESKTIKYKIKAEYAQSRSEAQGSYVSTDGGLNFTALSTADGARGRAYGISGDVRLFNRLEMSAFYKSIGKDFSSSSTVSQQGKELMGFATRYALGPQTRLSVRHDIQDLLDGGNSQTQMQVGAQRTTVTAMQIIHQAKRGKVTGEYRHQDVQGAIEGIDAETNSQSDFLAVRGVYDVTDKTQLTLAQQWTLSGEPDYKTTLGMSTEVREGFHLRVQEIMGPEGLATSLGASIEPFDRMQLSGDYVIAGSQQGAVEFGIERQVDEQTAVQISAKSMMSADGPATAVTFGGSKDLTDDVKWTTQRTLTTAKNISQEETAYVLSKGSRQVSVSQQSSSGEEDNIQTNQIKIKGPVFKNMTASLGYERGRVQNHDLTEYERDALNVESTFNTTRRVHNQALFSARMKMEGRWDEGVEDVRQFYISHQWQGQPTENFTWSGRAEVSRSENTTTNTITARFEEYEVGGAYRPLKTDWLNLMGRYTFQRNDKPAGQTDSADVEQMRAHILSAEMVMDITPHWQWSQKLAYRREQEKVTDFDLSQTSTWMAAQRLTYLLADDWRLAAEYRILRQQEAKDSRHGVEIEVIKDIGEFVQVGAGYNFTDFNDDLTNLDYTTHGPFVRVSAIGYDLSPTKRQTLKAKLLAGRSIWNLRQEAFKRLSQLEEAIKGDQQAVIDLYRHELKVLAKEKYTQLKAKQGNIKMAQAYLDLIDARIEKDVQKFTKDYRKYKKNILRFQQKEIKQKKRIQDQK